jgi:Nucleotidyltransferase domain
VPAATVSPWARLSRVSHTLPEVLPTSGSPTCVDPAPLRLVLFGSRARGVARRDADHDLLVVMPQARLTPQGRHVVARALREGQALDDAG